MINELDNNKRSLNAMSDLEFAKNETEMMRYRPNSLSYKLGLCGLGCSVMAAFIGLNSFNPNNFQVILKILLNIFILLLGFLCCEKAKAYSQRASIVLGGLGVICGMRIFWVPLNIIVAYNSYKGVLATLASSDSTVDQINAATEAKKALETGPWLGQTVMSEFTESDYPIAYLPASGNFRGIFAIVFLVCAAGLLISAGVIGLAQSKKLTNYLSSISIKKK